MHLDNFVGGFPCADALGLRTSLKRALLSLVLVAAPELALAQDVARAPEIEMTDVQRIVEAIFQDNSTQYTSSRRIPSAFVLGQDPKGKKGEEFVQVKCKATMAWDVENGEQVKGAIQIGICDRMAELPPSKLVAAESLQKQFVHFFSGQATSDEFFKPYLPRTINLESTGIEGRYLAVMVAGHGFAIVHTLFVELPDTRRTVLIQLHTGNCIPESKNSPCANPVNLLQRLGGAVARYLANQ